MAEGRCTSGCDGTDGTHACCRGVGSAVAQSLDEMDFERGIWYAAQNRDVDRVRTLLRAGTPVDKRDAAGYTALHYAVRAGDEEIVSELLRAGADINARTRAGQATPLHRAASAGKQSVVKLLLAHGASVVLKDVDGKTALHRAVESKSRGICKELLNANPQLKSMMDEKNRFPADYADDDSDLVTLLRPSKFHY